jgi:hypothetical protein
MPDAAPVTIATRPVNSNMYPLLASTFGVRTPVRSAQSVASPPFGPSVFRTKYDESWHTVGRRLCRSRPLGEDLVGARDIEPVTHQQHRCVVLLAIVARYAILGDDDVVVVEHRIPGG